MKQRRLSIIISIICLIILASSGVIISSALSISKNPEVKAASKKDSKNNDAFFLSETASFKIKVSDGVYCVPVNMLGGSKYSNDEILDMIDTRDPKKISKNINTLFDAVKYYYFSGFKTLQSDHKDLAYDGVIWQHHKSGSEALIANEGDCSGNASLIAYLLDGDYDETGYFSYNLENGSGHVFNYFKKDKKYYFLDFSVINYAVMECNLGNRQNSYYRSNLFMADSVDKFIAYYKRTYLNSMTSIYNTYSYDRVAPIGYKNGKYYLPNDIKDIKFYGDKNKINVIQTNKPKDIPSWNRDGLLDRDLKADISTVLYSFMEYEGRNSYYSLRFYSMNDVTSRISKISIKYINSSKKVFREQNLSETQIENEISFNNSIFDYRDFNVLMLLDTKQIKGDVEFTDIHGNVFTKKFDFTIK
jgi:hypothetical protein